MSEIKMLPCPFCGGQPYMQSDSDVDGCYWSKVRCRSCGATTRGKWASSSDSTCPQWYAEVREEWNARAVAEHNVAARDAEIERLRAEVAAWRELSDHVRAGACNAIWPDRYTDARTRDVAAALKRAEPLVVALKRARESIEEWAHFAQSCGGEITGLQEELSEIDLTLHGHDREVGIG